MAIFVTLRDGLSQMFATWVLNTTSMHIWPILTLRPTKEGRSSISTNQTEISKMGKICKFTLSLSRMGSTERMRFINI